VPEQDEKLQRKFSKQHIPHESGGKPTAIGRLKCKKRDMAFAHVAFHWVGYKNIIAYRSGFTAGTSTSSICVPTAIRKLKAFYR
jgi:hypothetical protein